MIHSNRHRVAFYVTINNLNPFFQKESELISLVASLKWTTRSTVDRSRFMRLLSATMATRANPGGKSMCGLKFPPPQYLNAIYIFQYFF